MDPEHLPYVVREHLRLFPDGFFARLGPGFLAAYTRTYLTSPHALAFIAVAKQQPVGYLVGVTDPALHRRHVLRRHGGTLLIRALGGLAVRPGLLVHFLRTRAPRYYRKLMRRQQPGQATPVAPQASLGPGAVLAHIAVDESARSLGIGVDLIERFVAASAIAGCARVSLVTMEGPGGAGPYYERRGWRREGGSSTPEGRRLLTYERVLDTPSWPPGRTRQETGEPPLG
ncbi:GNAT family N-acetyltransferase [Streptomyces sp. NPDC059255]|uniref:GNAT family N-acetyltransferase n=1 Tax=Streptomyces sp. NPDC059255 TaxID=3346793 RepID=UPI0036A979F0